ncbi:hypothetical protein VTL71DRAFT_11314 [Oculimacula yallundae]|uniref:Low temperature requirement A n=1 Tax=Oculimacula yallundae TaxID=86028 RepID=A0ABR4CRY9_9HELO
MEYLYSEKAATKSDLLSLYNARTGEKMEWVVSPLKDLEGKEFRSFHVRHEASMLELFFDLFFVANLATFTACHSITTSETVFVYVGFFLILWTTWFQITIFDVRFAADSFLERSCKMLQFISFAIFAAAGSTFNPGTSDSYKYYRFYQTMAIILGLTRFLMACQYAIVAYFVCRKYKSLIVPFVLIIFTFLVSGACLSATNLSFTDKAVSNAHIIWWIVLPAESIIVVTISSVWRTLSFKETHINERLSLLTMIIIGEGVIGVTKTVGYLWPTEQLPTWGNAVAMLSIIVMLLLMWQMYFDNHPHGHYGTIKQQWWALSHFSLHLGIVGVVEGSNRMAIIYNATTVWASASDKISTLCSTSSVVGNRENFVQTVNDILQSLKLERYHTRSSDWVEYYLNKTLYQTSSPHYCILDAALPSEKWTEAMWIKHHLSIGIFRRFDIQDAASNDSYYHTFNTTYSYLWCSVGLTMFMLLAFLWIVRRGKHDRFEWVRMISRFIIALLAVALACMSLVEVQFNNFIRSPWVVSTICFLMALVLTIDRTCRFLGVRNFEQQYGFPLAEKRIANHGSRMHQTSIDFRIWNASGPWSTLSSESEMKPTTMNPTYSPHRQYRARDNVWRRGIMI